MSHRPTPQPDPDGARWSRRGFDLALVALFALTLVTPGLGLVAGTEGTGQLMENRALAPPPACPGPDEDRAAWLETLPSRFDAWFSDHFAFRDLLIEWNTVVSVLWLDSPPEIGPVLQTGPRRMVLDPLARTVLQGRDDWFYYFGEGMLDDHRGLSPMGRGDLLDWQERLERRRNALERRGVDYLLVVVPEKQSIYPEHLPRAIVQHGPTRAQQLVEHLRAHSSVPVLDLRPVLEDAKRERQSYHRTGTHWNDFGALRASQAVLASLAERHPHLTVPRDEDFRFSKEAGPGRQFMALVGLRSRVREDYTVLEPLAAPRARATHAQGLLAPPGGDVRWSVLAKTTGRKELPRAVVFHDSFVAVGMEAILSERFESVVYYWRGDFSWEPLRNDPPEIVIEEHAERFFLTELAPDPPRARTGR